ncbi:MAG: hypothetical protein PHN82_01010 [bacterium]|nr:hypothetical protein [bacterium]
MDRRDTIIAAAVFAVALVVFSLARARIFGISAEGPARARLLTGDEPAYMLLAHSVAFDRDFNLYNNRVEGHGRHFGMERCDEHGARKDWERREIYSIHTPGLPILIAPAYALGLRALRHPRAAVAILMNVLAALLAANTYLFCRSIVPAAGERAAFLCTAAVAFTPPVIFYGSLVYPELPAALIILYALRRALPRLPLSPAHLVAATGIAFLPWLSFRFFLPAFVLAWLLAGSRAAASPRPRVAAAFPVLPLLASLALFFWYQYRAFGSVSPAAGYALQDFARRGYASRGALDGLAGLLLDRGHGILTWSPVYVIAPAGLALLLKADRALGARLLLLLASIYIPGAMFVFWWGGFAPPPRYMVVPAPLLGGALCCLFARGKDPFLRLLFGILLAVSLALGTAGAYRPGFLYKHRHIAELHRQRRMARVFPSFFRKTDSTWPLAAAWGGALIGLNVYLATRRRKVVYW